MKHLILLALCALPVTVSAQSTTTTKPTPEQVTKTKRANYKQTLTKLEIWRTEQGKAYKSGSAKKKAELIATSRKKILTTLTDEVFPAWYGTPWDFNGVSQTPGEGKIACGYFVNTCLRDVGFKLPRIKFSQQPSGKIIRVFCPRSTIKVSSKRSMENITADLNQSGDGLYMVGLDSHVGFILVSGKKHQFIHADYYNRATGVKSEKTTDKNPLSDSKYRMIGKLLTDEMVKNWLIGHQYALR